MRSLVVVVLFFGLAHAAFLYPSDDQLDDDLDIEQRSFLEDKKPCCFPDTFEAFFGERIEHGSVKEEMVVEDFTNDISKEGRHHPRPHRMTRMGVLGRMSVDSPGKKVAMKMRIMQRPRPRDMIAVIDYTKKMMYIADPDKKTCQKIAASQQMEKMCIPDNSTYAGSFRWGSGDNSIKVDAWKSRVAHRKPMPVFMGVEVLVASGSCVPLTERGGGIAGRMRIGFEASFVDLNTTISDPDVFNPPSYCDQAEYVDLNHADPTVLSFTSRFVKH